VVRYLAVRGRRVRLAAAGAAGLALIVPVLAAHAEPQVRIPVPGVGTGFEVDGVFGGFGYLGVSAESRKSGASKLVLIDTAGIVTRVDQPGTVSVGGGIDGATIVYAEWSRTTGALVLYDRVTGLRTLLTAAPLPRYAPTFVLRVHPTISGPWVLYGNEAGDRVLPSKTSVVLYNVVTQQARVIASGTGVRSVEPGQVAGDWATWVRLGRHGQDVYLTNIASQATHRLARPRGVHTQYSPAVTDDGTVYFARNRPCRRRCPKPESPAIRVQLVAQPLNGKPRVVANLPKGVEVGAIYADKDQTRTRVLYSRFRWVGDFDLTAGDVFAFTAAT
jgi:hypothetical protein